MYDIGTTFENPQGSTRLGVRVSPSPLPLYGYEKMKNTWSLFCWGWSEKELCLCSLAT
jgi:hypothetical protein